MSSEEEKDLDPQWLRTWYWKVWAIVLALSFAIPEAIALMSKGSGGTLSERIRALIGIYPERSHRKIGTSIFVVLMLGFTIWFVPHIIQWPIAWAIVLI